jgi:hypothetical protein
MCQDNSFYYVTDFLCHGKKKKQGMNTAHEMLTFSQPTGMEEGENKTNCMYVYKNVCIIYMCKYVLYIYISPIICFYYISILFIHYIYV